MKFLEKRVNRCVARLSDYLASTAKIDVFIVEKKCWFVFLDLFDKFIDLIFGVWFVV